MVATIVHLLCTLLRYCDMQQTLKGLLDAAISRLNPVSVNCTSGLHVKFCVPEVSQKNTQFSKKSITPTVSNKTTKFAMTTVIARPNCYYLHKYFASLNSNNATISSCQRQKPWE